MKVKMKKSLLAVSLAVAFSATGTNAMAVVYPDFTVSEGSVAGTPTNTFVADKITGNYVEVISFTGAGTFDVSLKWNAGQFVGQDGAVPQSTVGDQYLGAPNGGGGYGLYALYQGSGTFSTSGGITTFTTTAGTGSLSVFIDALKNTTFTQAVNGSSAWGTGLIGDDYLIASGTPQAGSGQLNPFLSTCGPSILNPTGSGINCGSFGTSSTFALTAAGMSYFTSPVPFYNFSFQSGQLNNFDVSGTQIINGSMDVVFNNVPEPTSVALIGIGLLGLGLSKRSKQA